ncbi:unnamed protein product [Mesocestoides corti]|uniref:Uncharacterized protein n=1 Tax=Mesocestoides corti TaxID=53468 RepID=A0A0R3U2B4_MESCO|nr:unnamed protein product [Mesocestoides corti]
MCEKLHRGEGGGWVAETPKSQLWDSSVYLEKTRTADLRNTSDVRPLSGDGTEQQWLQYLNNRTDLFSEKSPQNGRHFDRAGVRLGLPRRCFFLERTGTNALAQTHEAHAFSFMLSMWQETCVDAFLAVTDRALQTLTSETWVNSGCTGAAAAPATGVDAAAAGADALANAAAANSASAATPGTGVDGPATDVDAAAAGADALANAAAASASAATPETGVDDPA